MTFDIWYAMTFGIDMPWPLTLIYHDMLLSIIVHCCPLLSIVVNCCQLLSIVVHCCPSHVHCCPLSCIVVHCYQYSLLPIVVHICPSFSIVVHCCQSPPISDMIYFTIDWWYIVKISYSLIYCECTGTGTDGTCTGTDDTGMSFDGTGTGTEGTDSTSTGAYDSGTILSHFHWWILRLSAIQKKSLTDLLTHSVNNIGLRDASASKNFNS